MMTLSVPPLDLAESSAVALTEAAEELSAAASPAAFLAALDTNHKVWTALAHISHHRGWAVPDRRLTAFALSTTARCGRAVPDAHVEALIRLDREVSAALAGGDVESLRARARLLWRQNSRPPGLDAWLTAFIPARSHPKPRHD